MNTSLLTVMWTLDDQVGGNTGDLCLQNDVQNLNFKLVCVNNFERNKFI